MKRPLHIHRALCAIGFAMGVAIAVTLVGAKKPANTPPSAPLAALPPVGPLYSIGGQGGLPRYLTSDEPLVADADGIMGGEIRSVDPNAGAGDFTFDLLFKVSEEKKDKDIVVGVGSVKEGRKTSVQGISLHIEPAHKGGGVHLTLEKGKQDLGKLGSSAGPHLVRIHKAGTQLTFAICANYKGTFTPTIGRTLPGVTIDPSNAGIFATGPGTWMSTSLAIVGKILDAGDATAAAKVVDSAEPLIALAKSRQLPALFTQRHDLNFTPDGLDLATAHELVTSAGNFINKNFTLDIVYNFKSGGKNDKGLFLGFGDGATEKPKGRGKIDGIELHVHGGKATLKVEKEKGPHEVEVAKPRTENAGPMMIRLRKRGDLLAIAICSNYGGTFAPQITRNLVSIKAAAHTLGARNSFLYLHGEGTVEQMRLVTEGDCIGSTDVAMLIPTQAVEGRAMRQMLIADPRFVAGKRLSIDPVVAPKGLAISPSGELTWTPAHDQVGSHHFNIVITENGQTTLEPAEIEVISAQDVLAAGGDLSKVAGLYELAVESENHQVTPGMDKTLLLLEGDQLRRLGPDGLLVQQTIKLPKSYIRIAERADCFVALSDAANVIDVIDKKTMQIRRSAQMAYGRHHDVCLHPLQPLTYISVERSKTGGGADSQIVVFDERTGEVREPKGCVGNWVRISPDGQTLYTGYREVFQTGRIAGFNPTTFDPIPEYGDIARLIVYDNIGGVPHVRGQVNEAGGNGQGIELSPDGKRISYLSYVGYPAHTGNIPAWDTTDMTKRPVAYPCKDKADCKRMAYHPSLPIVAVPSESAPGRVVFFDRETGQLQNDRVELRQLPPQVKVNAIYFSPDGRSVLLDCENKVGRSLRKEKLVLSAAEIASLK